MKKIPKIFILFLILSAAFKCLLLGNVHWINFDSDQAVMGLMARHTNLQEFPLFYYGQNYGGGLEHLLAALAFKVFPPTIETLRGVALFLLWCCEALFLFGLHHRSPLDRGQALLATIFFSFGSLSFITFFNVLYGSHLNSLFYMCAWFFLWSRSENWSDYAFLKGLIIGLGIWHSYFLIIYLVPTFIALAITRKSMPFKSTLYKWIQFLLSIMIGAAPRIYFWIYPESWRVIHRGSDFYFFFKGLWQKLLGLFTATLPEFYFANKWSVHDSSLENLTVVFFISILLWSCLLLIWNTLKNIKKEDRFLPFTFLLLALASALSLMLASPEGMLAPTRFFYPAHFLISLAFGYLLPTSYQGIKKIVHLSLVRILFVVFVLFVSLISIEKITSGQFGGPEFQRKKILETLNEQNCSIGYADYSWAYLLDFLSSEKTTFIPINTSRIIDYEEKYLLPTRTSRRCFLLSKSNESALKQLKSYWINNPDLEVKSWQFEDQFLYVVEKNKIN